MMPAKRIWGVLHWLLAVAVVVVSVRIEGRDNSDFLVGSGLFVWAGWLLWRGAHLWDGVEAPSIFTQEEIQAALKVVLLPAAWLLLASLVWGILSEVYHAWR
jgi:hypothetical protein